MSNDRLYKYLDADGGLRMLYNRTLMFTNATQLNDPFDCHPAYIHLSGEMPAPYKGWSPEIVSWLEMTIDPEAFRLKEELIEQ
jgi:hypothetical protein